MSGRTKALTKNILAGWISEAVALIIGLILPRFILLTYGSSCNGLLNSITQFLGFSTLLRAGVGAATRVALFKPLADGDKKEINKIMAATQSYMHKISFLVGLYIAVLAVVFPFVAQGEYDWWYIFTLTFIIGSSTFIDNLIGIKYKVLLQADQKYYIELLCAVASKLASFIISVILIKLGQSIHVVKIGASLAMLISPIALTIYVKKRYVIDFSVKVNNGIIAQRWDAFAQQMAIVLNANVGLTLLSLFADLKEVSVFTTYYMVSNIMNSIVVATSMGITSTLGNIAAKGDEEHLRKSFSFVEWGYFAACSVLFSATAVMITPFIRIYTSGVVDVNYIRPFFGTMMTTAALAECMKRPYQSLVDAVGHFKQTRNSAIIEVVINVVVSFVLFQFFGIVGVAIGSFVASLYRSVYLAIYAMKNIINVSKSHLIKLYVPYFVIYVMIVVICNKTVDIPHNYFSWVCYAVLVSVIALAIVATESLIFHRKELQYLKSKIMTRPYNKE